MNVVSGRTLASYSRELRIADDEWRLRVLLHEFGLVWNDAPINQRSELVADEPGPIDQRWDCFVAAYAEHLSWHANIDAPRWALDPKRYLPWMWFVADWSPTLKVEAIVHAPAAFEAHGVLLSDRELVVI